MKKNTRFAFNAYLQQLARLNGVAVEELSSKFTVEPSVQQTLEDQIQQSAAFLTLINVTPVTELETVLQAQQTAFNELVDKLSHEDSRQDYRQRATGGNAPADTLTNC